VISCGSPHLATNGVEQGADLRRKKGHVLLSVTPRGGWFNG